MGRYYRRLVMRIIKHCRKIITVSNFECNRIRSFLNLEENRITAIHNGYSQRFQPLEISRTQIQKYLPDEEYLFFLGNTDPKKHAANIESIQPLSEKIGKTAAFADC